jgi:putative ABC transport system substrate-binding protein
MGGKWLDVLKKIAPRVTRVAVLFNPTTAPFFDRYLRAVAAAAPSYGVVPVPTPVQEAVDFDRTIAAFARESNGDGGLFIISDSFLLIHRDRIVALAAQHSLPAVYAGSKALFASGGLVSYGDDYVDQLHGTASCVDRILREKSRATCRCRRQPSSCFTLTSKSPKRPDWKSRLCCLR